MNRNMTVADAAIALEVAVAAYRAAIAKWTEARTPEETAAARAEVARATKARDSARRQLSGSQLNSK